MASMLKRLFSRPPANKLADTAEGQLRQLETLRPAQGGTALLLALARQGARDEIRQRAVEMLEDHDALEELLADPSIGDAAARRLAALLEPAEIVDRARSDSRLAAAALRVATLETAQGLALLDALCDERALRAAAMDARDPEVRLAAVTRLRSEATLAALERDARNHDKRLLRAVRGRLDLLRELKAKDADLSRRLAELCDRLEHLARRDEIPQEQRRLAQREADHLLGSWERALEEHARVRDEALGFDWQPSALDALLERFDIAAKRIAALQATEQAAEEEAVSVANETRSAAAQSLQATLEGLRSGTIDVVRDMALVRTALNLERERFASAGRGSDPETTAFETDAALVEAALAAAANLRRIDPPSDPPALPDPDQLPGDPAAFEPIAAALSAVTRERRRLEREIRAVDWPTALAEPAALVALRKACQRLEEAERRGGDLVNAVRTRLASTIDELERHVDAGELGAALAARALARQWLACLPRRSGEDEQARLNALAARVEELKDWREFAAAPKREALCQEMENLAGSPLPPADQARAVRALRDQWRTLGAPRNAADQSLRERFDAAAERAFEPCRAYFEAEAQRREANARTREEIIEQLSAFAESVDWEQANWKSIETILRTADREWRAAFPVPRKGARQQQRRFEAARRIIDERLQAEYARNLERLQAIVDEAEALVGQETPLAARMDAAKALQKRWQATGPTPPRRNRTLWKRFRAACDAVFAERDAERDAGRQERAARTAAIEALAEELEGRLEGGAQPDDAAALGSFNERFAALGGHERAKDSRLAAAMRRFEDLRERLEARIASARHAERIAEIAALVRAADAVAAIEAGDDGSAAADLAAAGESVARALGPRLDAISAGQRLSPPSPTARRELCIEVEIIAGLESPESDRALRMQVQVERLSRGMSGRERSDPLTLLEDLATRWSALPVSDDHDLDPRFAAAFAEALADVAR